MNADLFNKDLDYWGVTDTIKEIYLSDSLLSMLLDFEAVLDEVSIYAFKNWKLGELVEGPEISRYSVKCTFLWPLKLMPDPRGAKRLLPFDCVVKYKKTSMKVPKKIKSSDDMRELGKKADLMTVGIWLVSIEIPKDLISDMRSGSIELEGQEIELEDLGLNYVEMEELTSDANIDEDGDFADEMQDQNSGDPFA